MKLSVLSESITEARYDDSYLGQLKHSFGVDDKMDAYKLATYLQHPKIGWHAKVESGGETREGRLGQWVVTLVINVDRKNLKQEMF